MRFASSILFPFTSKEQFYLYVCISFFIQNKTQQLAESIMGKRATDG